MATAKWKTAYNATPVRGEINNQPSETVPDQSLSVKEILARYASGLPLGGQKVPVYNGEEDYTPDLDRLDLSERFDLIQANKDRIKDMQTDLQNQQRAKQLKKQQKQQQQDQQQQQQQPGTPPSGGASVSQ